jgi:hypothetical protein
MLGQNRAEIDTNTRSQNASKALNTILTRD